MKKARLFTNDSVFIRRDEMTGDVILSARPRQTWADFLALQQTLGLPEEDFPRDIPRSESRNPFEGWSE